MKVKDIRIINPKNLGSDKVSADIEISFKDTLESIKPIVINSQPFVIESGKIKGCMGIPDLSKSVKVWVERGRRRGVCLLRKLPQRRLALTWEGFGMEQSVPWVKVTIHHKFVRILEVLGTVVNVVLSQEMAATPMRKL